MGSPARNFNVLVDSGSADLWVGAEGCRGDDGGSCVSPFTLIGLRSSLIGVDCQGNHTLLGAHSSTTFNASQDDWAIGYVSGFWIPCPGRRFNWWAQIKGP